MPLSPHLQTYRLPLTAWLSILHRGTGVVLALSLPLLAWGLHSLSRGNDSFGYFLSLLNNPIGYLFAFALSFALIYHLCNGVRHMFWDMGWGFDKTQIQRSAYTVIGVALLLTFSFWTIVYASSL